MAHLVPDPEPRIRIRVAKKGAYHEKSSPLGTERDWYLHFTGDTDKICKCM